MEFATLSYQIKLIFKMVVAMIVLNVCWALLIMRLMKRIRILEREKGDTKT